MKRNTIYKLIFVPVMLFSLQSCFVARDYQRPEVVNEAYFRTDLLPEDSITMAEVSWKELFTDPVLRGHIEKGLENNLDIRIALQQIEAANAYYKQGKASFLPTIGLQGKLHIRNCQVMDKWAHYTMVVFLSLSFRPMHHGKPIFGVKS